MRGGIAGRYREARHGRDGRRHRGRAAIDPPDQLVDDLATLTVGGRPVQLRYLGRGHTDNDLVLTVPDVGLVIAGDLVEEGAPPQFGSAYPLDWPGTLDAVAELVTGQAGAGARRGRRPRVPRAGQRAEHAELVAKARDGHANGRPGRGRGHGAAVLRRTARCPASSAPTYSCSDLTSRNSSSPYRPSSRPVPDCL